MPQDMGTTNVPTQSPADMLEATVICCDACLDIAGAQDFYNRLQAALKACQPVVLDATHIERVDTTALQILCAFFREAEVHGLVVQWQHPSPALQNAARLLNVSTCLALSAG
jgi:ABC-type transporter Mla MlaB component